jgi:hypothetical protein
VTDPRIVEKLRKLVEHERSARGIGNLEEATAFAAKVQDLLLRHKLEMSDVEYRAEEEDEPVLKEFIPAEEWTRVSHTLRLQSWIGILVATVAKANFCEAVRSGKGIYLVGRQSDREASKLLFKYLYEIALEVAPLEAQAYMRTHRFLRDALLSRQSGAVLKRTFQSGWKLGYASALHKRLEANRGQLLAGAAAQGLIRIDQLERSLEEAIKLHFPSLRKSGEVSTKGVSGYRAGQKYGSEVGINSRKRLRE